MVAVISHDEKMVFRNRHRTKSDSVVGIAFFGIKAVFIVIWLPVDKDFSTLYFDSVSRQADHPFNKILAWIDRIYKYDDIISLRLTHRHQCGANKRDFNTIDKFIDQDVISNE